MWAFYSGIDLEQFHIVIQPMKILTDAIRWNEALIRFSYIKKIGKIGKGRKERFLIFGKKALLMEWLMSNLSKFNDISCHVRNPSTTWTFLPNWMDKIDMSDWIVIFSRSWQGVNNPLFLGEQVVTEGKC